MGFTVQSILRRIPRLVSPLVGGALISALGVVAGMRVGFATTLVLAGLTLLVVSRMDLPVSRRGRWGSGASGARSIRHCVGSSSPTS